MSLPPYSTDDLVQLWARSRARAIAKAHEKAIGPILRKLLCLTGKHHYRLVGVDGHLGMFSMVVCDHCNLGHKVNTSFR